MIPIRKATNMKNLSVLFPSKKLVKLHLLFKNLKISIEASSANGKKTITIKVDASKELSFNNNTYKSR
jgi:hypothetical protein